MLSNIDTIPLGIQSVLKKQLTRPDITEIIDVGFGRGVKVSSTGETAYLKGDRKRYEELLRASKLDSEKQILELYDSFLQQHPLQQQETLEGHLEFCIQKLQRVKDKIERENATKKVDVSTSLSRLHDTLLEVIASLRHEISQINTQTKLNTNQFS